MLGKLTPRHQVVLVLRGVDGLPFAEIGEQMP
jgi:DNA-directed RNA polymerase specialized sigma24 family protein